MKHFNTLEAYENLIASGTSPKEAKCQVQNMDRFFSDLVSEFASQKMISIMGTIIIAIGSFLIIETWNLSIKMEGFNQRLTSIEQIIKK